MITANARNLVCKLLSAAMLCAAAMASAQTRYFLLAENTVNPGQQTAFEAAQHDYCAAIVRGGAPACTILAPTTFSPANHFLTLIAFSDFSHYDQGTYTSKGLTPEQARDLNARRGPTIASTRESAVQLRASNHAPPDPSRTLVLLSDVQVRPGREDEFLALLQTALNAPATRSAPGRIEVFQTLLNGQPTRFLIAQHLPGFAALDAADPLLAPPAPGQRHSFEDAIARCVQTTEVTVMRLRPDLGAPGSGS